MMIAAKKQLGIQYIFIEICKNYVFLHAILHMLNRGSICFVVLKSVGTFFSLHSGAVFFKKERFHVYYVLFQSFQNYLCYRP